MYENTGLTSFDPNVPGVYTITYAAGSAGQTLTVEWIEGASTDGCCFTDNVVHPRRRRSRSGGGGGRGGSTGAVRRGAGREPVSAGLVEKDGLPAGTDVRGQFFSAETCEDDEPAAARRALEPSSRTRTASPRSRSTACRTSASATAVTREGASRRGRSVLRPLELRHRGPEQHVVADGGAARLPDDSDTGHLRTKGQARWFKVPILANSRVDVTLSGLPADYDLVVFSDIQQAYNRITDGATRPAGPEPRARRPRARGCRDAGRRLQHVAVQPVLVGSDELGPDAQQRDLQPVRVVADRVVADRVERLALLALGVVAVGVVAVRVVAIGVVTVGVVAVGVVTVPVVARRSGRARTPADPRRRSRPRRPRACSRSPRRPGRATRASP